MRKRTRVITISALFSALSVLFLYIASIWPTGRFGLAALASLFVAAAVIESGLGAGIYVYIVSSIISMLILPIRTAPFLFLLFFGYYPVIKSLIERIGPKPLQWALKLLVFNASLSAIFFLLSGIVFGQDYILPGVHVAYFGGNVVFVLFDYGFTKVIWLYIERVSKFLKKDM